MIKKRRFILVLIALTLVAANGFSQSVGSLLVRAKHAKLIVHGEVIGRSDISNLCYELPCQVVVLRVKEVLKGTYKSKNIKILFMLGGGERYVEKNSQYSGLSRYFFNNGKTWIVMIHQVKGEGTCPLVSFTLNSFKDYERTTCMQGSLDSIIPGDPEEIVVMKEFIKSKQKSSARK